MAGMNKSRKVVQVVNGEVSDATGKVGGDEDLQSDSVEDRRPSDLERVGEKLRNVLTEI
jgi:hypothetical protein